MDRTHKEDAISSLHESLKGAELVVIAHQEGLTVAEVTSLRRKIRDAGAGYRVTKNRLARLALKGTRFEGLDAMFKGPTAVAYSSDPVAAAKVIADFAKTNDRLKLIGAGLGDKVLDRAATEMLAKLPSLNELRAKLVGVLNAPATKVAGVLQAPAAQLARVMSAKSKAA